MAYEKLYSRTNWVDNQAPAISAANLNKMDSGINKIDDRLVDTAEKVATAEENIAALQKSNETLSEGLADATDRIGEVEEAQGIMSEDVAQIASTLDTLSRTTSPAITETAIGTSVSVKDTAEGYVDILAHGKYEQDSTTGAQLVDIADFELVNPDTRTASFAFETLSAGTYHLNIKLGGTATNVQARLYRYNAGGNVNYDPIILQDGDNEITCIGDADSIYFFIERNQADGATASISDVMLSVEPLPYEKYTGRKPAPNTDYPQEIKKSVVSEVLTHHKNFLIPPPTTNKNGIELIVDDNGYMTLNGTASVTSYFTVYQKNELPIGNKYALSATDPLPSGVSFVIRNRDSSATTYQLTSTKQAVTFANDRITEKNWVAILVVEAGKTFTNARFAVQLEEGTSITDYAPYTESVATLSNPIELGGLNGVEDVFNAKETKRRFAEVVFDGSDDEGWGTMNTNDNATKRVATRSLFAMPSVSNNSIPNILCTHYKAVTPANTHSRVKGITISGKPSDGGNTYLYVYDENFNTSDISLWKAHLAANPMTVVYELAEPTTEALPTADQIALNGLKSFDGVTYVETDSEVKPTIEVKCVLDTKAYIDRKFAELAQA